LGFWQLGLGGSRLNRRKRRRELLGRFRRCCLDRLRRGRSYLGTLSRTQLASRRRAQETDKGGNEDDAENDAENDELHDEPSNQPPR